MLEWDGCIHPLASAIKCVDKVTTVSPTYLQQLKYQSNGLEALFEYEQGKCIGILNGIDNEVWNPDTDPMINYHYHFQNFEHEKQKNKLEICTKFHLDFNKPLIVFIGRLVHEKAADILPGAIQHALDKTNCGANFLTPSHTSLTIFALMPTSSSRLMPGLRGIPAVMITTSESAMSS